MSIATVYGFNIADPTVAPDVTIINRSGGSLERAVYSYYITYNTVYGETIPGPNSATVDMVGDALQLDMPARPKYVNTLGLYRSINGGTFYKLTETDKLVFIDDGTLTSTTIEAPVESKASSFGVEYSFIAKSLAGIKSLTVVSPTGVDVDSADKLFGEYNIIEPGAGSYVKLLPADVKFNGMTQSIVNNTGADLIITPSDPITDTILKSQTLTLVDGDSISLLSYNANWQKLNLAGGVGGATGVTTLSTGTTGLTTEITGTSDTILGGILAVKNGGTGSNLISGLVYSDSVKFKSTLGNSGELITFDNSAEPTWTTMQVSGTTLSNVTEINVDGELDVIGDVTTANNITVNGVWLSGNPPVQVTTPIYTIDPADTTLLCKIPPAGVGIVGGSFPDAQFSCDITDSGNTMAITVGNNVQVYDWIGSAWVQRGANISAATESTIVAISKDGNRVVIGDIDFNAATGRVFVYVWLTTAWFQLGATIKTGEFGRLFGRSVDINSDGSRVIIGQPLYNVPNGQETLQVYNPNTMSFESRTFDIVASVGRTLVYEYNGVSWELMGDPIIGEIGPTGSHSQEGSNVAINADGTIIATGGPRLINSEVENGLARVFEWNGVAWIQRGDSFTGGGGNTGVSVDFNNTGSTVCIGSRNSLTNGGLLQIYDWTGAAWVQRGVDIAALSNNDYVYNYSTFGTVSADGNAVLFASIDNSGGGRAFGIGSGALRIFDWSGGAWTLRGDVIYGAPGQRLGTAAAINTDGCRFIATSSVSVTGATVYECSSSTFEITMTLPPPSANRIIITTFGEKIVSSSANIRRLFSTLYTNEIITPPSRMSTLVSDGVDWYSLGCSTVNEPPFVSAGPDTTALVGIAITLQGSYADDGINVGGVVLTWSQVSGPGVTSFVDDNDPTTNATFDTVGTYILALTADDGIDISSDTVNVVVSPSAPARISTLVGPSDDYFGESISISTDSNTIAVARRGKFFFSGGAFIKSPGFIHVYDWDGSGWVQRGSTIDVGSLLTFTCSLSTNNTVLLHENSDTKLGHVFDWNGLSWIQRGPDFTLSGLRPDGIEMARDNPNIVIGSLSTSGPTIVREWDGVNWSQRGQSFATNSAACISPDGDAIFVGDTSSGSPSGYVYIWDGATWVIRAQLNSDGVLRLASVADITNNGNTVAFYDTGSASNFKVHIFDWNGLNYVARPAVIVSAFREWQISLSDDGLLMLVGDRTVNNGSTRLYNWDGVAWTLLTSHGDGNYCIALAGNGESYIYSDRDFNGRQGRVFIKDVL